MILRKMLRGGGLAFLTLAIGLASTIGPTVQNTNAAELTFGTNNHISAQGQADTNLSDARFIAQYVDQSGKVYAWGRNTSNELQTGDTSDSRSLPYPMHLPSKAGKVKKVVRVGKDTRILDVNGNLWIVAASGTLNNGSAEKDGSSIEASNVADVKGDMPEGNYSGRAVWLNTDGTLTVKGLAHPTYSLPNGIRITDYAHVDLTSDTVKISAIGDDGKLYRFDNSPTASEVSGTSEPVIFKRIGARRGYNDAYQGFYELIRALDSQGRLWQWIDPAKGTAGTPELVDTEQTRFKNLSDSGAAAIDTDGNPWSLEYDDSNKTKLTKLPLPNGDTAEEISGDDTSLLMVLDTQNRVWTRGLNAYYSLGDGTNIPRYEWGRVKSTVDFGSDGNSCVAQMPTTGAPVGLSAMGLAALLMGLAAVGIGVVRRAGR